VVFSAQTFSPAEYEQGLILTVLVLASTDYMPSVGLLYFKSGKVGEMACMRRSLSIIASFFCSDSRCNRTLEARLDKDRSAADATSQRADDKQRGWRCCVSLTRIHRCSLPRGVQKLSVLG